jgi:hypothetical protein
LNQRQRAHAEVRYLHVATNFTHTEVILMYQHSILITISLAALICAAAGCQHDGRTQDEGASEIRDPESVPEPARHAVHSKQLAEIMSAMEAEVGVNWPQEIAEEKEAQREQARRARQQRAARMAKLLSNSAARIPEAIAGVELSQRERELFLNLTTKLEKQADALQKMADEADKEKLTKMLSRIEDTCYACHSQFSELAGSLDIDFAEVR